MKWKFYGQSRPDFAQEPQVGQESVWDYPRPPRWEHLKACVEIKFAADCVIRTENAIRVLETAGPPTVYIPPSAQLMNQLQVSDEQSWCEWKGIARYWSRSKRWRDQYGREEVIAWAYPEPTSEWQVLRNYLSFYPARIPCFINGEAVRPQGGGFYGGWVTDNIVGPWKGAPGTASW